MKPFDPEATCPKCGYDRVTVVYAAEGCPYPTTCGVRWNGGEHLDRTCQRCSHEWAEAVLPQPAPAAPGRREEAPDDQRA